MYIFLILLAACILLVIIVLKMPVFGRLPEGARLQRINAIPFVANDTFQNLSPTPMQPEGVTMWMILKKIIKGNPNGKPPRPLPNIKPDFTSETGTKVTWFGHSSYLLQVEKLKILVDPVFSKTTSPFSFIGNKSYAGTDFVHTDDFVAVDIIVITHDHYDHMDYQSILRLKSKVKHFVTSLGVGSHLERWGIPEDQIIELAWGEQATVSGLNFTATPGRHFTGRQFKRNHTLWSSFVLQTHQHKLFLGGDSGYDAHFKTIGDQHGPFDLAILECGQYNDFWPFIHMFPEETVMAALDLQAKVLLPVHWGKFTLSVHDWDESIKRVIKSAAAEGQAITTPQLGETVSIGEHYPDTQWWLNVVRA